MFSDSVPFLDKSVCVCVCVRVCYQFFVKMNCIFFFIFQSLGEVELFPLSSWSFFHSQRNHNSVVNLSCVFMQTGSNCNELCEVEYRCVRGNFISQWNRGWIEVWPCHPSNKVISQAEPQWDLKKRKKFPTDRLWKRSESLTHISPLRPWSTLMEKDRPFQVKRERLLSRTFG